MKNTNTRRSFLGKIATGTAAFVTTPYLVTARSQNRLYELERKAMMEKKYSANDQINLAVIGAGGMGHADTDSALRIEGVKLVAACDLYDGALQKARNKWGKDIMTTRDYKEILARKDIDAVIIATPDHWHKQISVDAMNKGKAVYCEKPMVHSIGEGPAVIAAQQKNKAVFQVGSQGMSSLGNEQAKKLLAEGAIGELNYAEGFWARNSPGGAWQYPIPKDASLETVGWEEYLSNNTKRDFDALRFFRWRNYRDYGTGVSGDLFVHLFSSLHFITNSKGPDKIMATGGLRYWKDGREVPDVLLGMFDYPETPEHRPFNLSLRVNFVDGTSGSTYLKLVGSEGAMDVKWREVVLRKNEAADPMADTFLQEKMGKSKGNATPSKLERKMGKEEVTFKASGNYKGAHYDHFNNFFTCTREGKTSREDAVFGYRAAAPALLCNDSYFDNKIIHWNPEKMELK